MPRKVFVAGEILTAADVNTNLMDQSVMVFDDATARATAIPTPVEGMVTYLKDEDEVTVFDGSAFKAVGPGQILQVVQGTFGTQTTTTSGTFQDTDLTVSITPSSATSQVYVIGTVTTQIFRGASISTGQGACAIDRNSGTIVVETILQYGAGTNANRRLEGPITLSAIDSPATSSAVTYTWQHKVISSANITSFSGNLAGFLIAMEVAG